MRSSACEIERGRPGGAGSVGRRFRTSPGAPLASPRDAIECMRDRAGVSRAGQSARASGRGRAMHSIASASNGLRARCPRSDAAADGKRPPGMEPGGRQQERRLRLFFSCQQPSESASGGRREKGRNAPADLGCDRSIRGLAMLASLVGKERGATGGDDPGILAGASLDEAPTSASRPVRVDELLAEHGRGLRSPSDAPGPSGLMPTRCADPDYNGIRDRGERITTDDVEASRRHVDRKLRITAACRRDARRQHGLAGGPDDVLDRRS